LLQKIDPFLCGIITVQVIAVSQVSTAHKDAVSSLLQAKQHMVEGYAAAAHDPNNPYITRVLKPTDPGQVSSCVSSPSTQETDYFGLKILFCHIYLPL